MSLLNVNIPKILLVDDNEINQFLGKKIFQKLGYTIDIASDGQEAVDFCLNNTVDLIFMDLQMPVLNGIDATIEILKNPNHKPIIIAITASLFEAEKDHCLEIGMSETLLKPYSGEDLQQIIHNYFPTTI